MLTEPMTLKTLAKPTIVSREPGPLNIEDLPICDLNVHSSNVENWIGILKNWPEPFDQQALSELTANNRHDDLPAPFSASKEVLGAGSRAECECAWRG